MAELSPDSLNAWRIYAIHQRLTQLAHERESGVCGTIAGVQEARARAVTDIRTIVANGWSPDINELTPELIEIALTRLERER